MGRSADCFEENCICRSVLLRVYRGLRSSGYDDASALRSAIRVLALRHPGHDPKEYATIAGRWIAAEAEEPAS